MEQDSGPISVRPRRGSRSGELVTSPATDAIRVRRARVNLGLLWRVAWRLLVVVAALVVLEVDLLYDDLDPDGAAYLRTLDTTEQLQVLLIAWAVASIGLTIGVQVLRIFRARAVQVPPARHYRGIPGPSSVLVATWWIAPAWALAIESRSSNDAGASWLVLDVVAIALLAVGVLASRAVSTVDLRDDELRWRGPIGTFAPGAMIETDVVPIAWEHTLIRFAFRMVGFTVWIMLSTVAGSLGSLAVAAVYAAVQVRSARRTESRSWRWREVRLVALGGGVPAVFATDDGVLDLAPMVSATSRNESMIWTIAELTRRAGAGDDVDTVDDQLRALARDAAHMPRPTATDPITLRPTAAHAVRGRLAPTSSIVIGVIVIAVIGIGALSGDVESVLTFVGVIVTLAVIFITLGYRASRLRLEVTPTELVVAGVRGTRRIPRDSIGAILGVPVMQQPTPGTVRVDVDGIVVHRDGALLARLRGGDWSPEQVDSLAASLGVPTAVIQDPLPITTLAHAFPGYAPTWEREPGKFGIIAAFVLIGIVAAVIVALDWDSIGGSGEDGRDASPEVSAQLRAEREFREEVDQLVERTFPGSEREGRRPSGCVDTAGGRTLLDSCALAPNLRSTLIEVAGQDPDTAVAALCRCTPSRFGFSYAREMRDPAAEPDSAAAYLPSPDAPRLLVDATLIQDDGPLKLLLDVRRDELGELRVHDVSCARGLPRPLASAAPTSTVADLRCTVEPDRPASQ